jgi:hypothetical protein
VALVSVPFSFINLWLTVTDSHFVHIYTTTDPLHRHEQGDSTRPFHDISAFLVWNERALFRIISQLSSGEDVDDSSELRLQANAACLCEVSSPQGYALEERERERDRDKAVTKHGEQGTESERERAS